MPIAVGRSIPALACEPHARACKVTLIDSPMRIAIVSPEFPPDIGGVETYAFEYVKELASRGHQVTVFTVRHARGEADLPGVRIEPVLRLCRAIDSETFARFSADAWHALNAAYAWIAHEQPNGLVSVHGCLRARRAGFGCVSVPSARVWHKVGTSFGSEASPLRTYFSTRNKLLWAEKNASRREWWSNLRAALRRLYPGLAVEAKAPMHKALLWAITGFVREWSRKFRDPQEAAHRRGVLDYVFRRFGDCPPQIRALTQAWAGARENTLQASGLGR